MTANVITAEEMERATDNAPPVSPEKFLPYRKLVAQLEAIEEAFVTHGEHWREVEALFAGIAMVDAEEAAQLAQIGRRLCVQHASQMCNASEEISQVVVSARRTTPRKRWEDSGCPDDRADAEDAAREHAAGIPSDSEDPEQ